MTEVGRQVVSNGVAVRVTDPDPPGPGVILFHHRTGLDDFTLAMAGRLTSEGWSVAVPDLFAYLPEGLDPEGLKQRLGDTWVVDAARASVGILADEGVTVRASIGFCMGGRLSFLIGALGVVSRAVCFYGGELDRGRQGGQSPLSLLHEGSAAIQLHRGSEDSAAAADVQERVISRAVEVGASLEACTYAGARHAFLNRDDSERYSERYAGRAWSSALAFLSGADSR